MIIVEYRCGTCRGRTERLVPSPPPSEQSCPACGSRAQRRYSPIGLVGRTTPPSRPSGLHPGPSCRDYPDVPGLCHMTPSAARSWVARARKDNRALETEIERQEQALDVAQEPDPVSHDHGHSPAP